jgi:general stress protein YciG
MKRVKLPRDPNQRAKATLDLILGNATPEPIPEKDQRAVESGRRGGIIGGKARAAKLTPERRSEIARKAAAARWGSKSLPE